MKALITTRTGFLNSHPADEVLKIDYEAGIIGNIHLGLSKIYPNLWVS